LNLNAEPQVESLLSAVAQSTGSLLMLADDGMFALGGKDPGHALLNPGVSSLLQKIIHAAGTPLVGASGRANDTAKTAVVHV
jgi:hypothetical protein